MASLTRTGQPMSLVLTPEVVRKLKRELMILTGDVVNSARELPSYTSTPRGMDPKAPRIDFQDYTRRGNAVARTFMASLVDAARKQMPIPQSDTFRFMDLPVEIRMSIYDLLLTVPNDINIYRWSTKRASKEAFMRVARFAVGTRQAPNYPGSWFLQSLYLHIPISLPDRQRTIPLGLTMGLLTTSRFISAEATKSMYSNNGFVFWKTPGFQMFADMVNSTSFALLRRMDLKDFDLVRDEKVLELFVRVPNIRTLTLTIECRFHRTYKYKRDGTLKPANEMVNFPRTRESVMDHLWLCLRPFVVGSYSNFCPSPERQRRLGLFTFRLGPTVLEHWGPKQRDARDLSAEEDRALRMHLEERSSIAKRPDETQAEFDAFIRRLMGQSEPE